MSLIAIHSLQIDPKLKAQLHAWHDAYGTIQEKQSLRNGTQITINLDIPVKQQIDEYLREPWHFAGMWSIRLPKGGYHVEHNHPQGRISGCLYVDVPDQKSGKLQIFGQELTVSEGMLVLFPSQMTHGTTVYEGEKPRLTVAFDVVSE